MIDLLKNDWRQLLADEFHKDYFKTLEDFVRHERQHETVYPAEENVFNALNHTAYKDVKVLLIGQDPYHGPGQAHGLSFSVPEGQALPPSLRNIYKELESDLGIKTSRNGNLSLWARQGVLLLNTSLTVRAGEAASHAGKGWETFTDAILARLNEREEPLIFLLWGGHARKKRKGITKPHHKIIESAHPSPLSAHRGFFGSRPFSKINQILREMKKAEIDWEIPGDNRQPELF